MLLACRSSSPAPTAVSARSRTSRSAARSPRGRSETPSFRELNEYNYFRRNVAGVQREWWYHRSGCRTWFQAERDTRTNEVLRVGLPGELEQGGPSA